MPTDTLPSVSLVIPLRNEIKYIADCLQSILQQDYPLEKMQILFVDGHSTDGTAAFLQQAALAIPQIRVLHNPNKTVPYAMNIGIHACTTDYIVRLDAHAIYQADYVSKSIEALLRVPCDNAGGVWDTRGRGYTGQAIAGALCTVFGVGNAHFRLGAQAGYVDTVPFGAFRRDLFDRIGLYDERLTRNQDNELNYRIRKHGGKVYLDPAIRCTYYCRDTLGGIMKMGFQNGLWNVVTMYLCPGAMGLRHFVPLLFVLATLGLPLLWLITGLSFFLTLLAIGWGAYLMLDAFYAYAVAEKQGWRFL
ncbi:MAG: glycosyltransferase family 2 protein, partial [Oscillospiraceae bacterium]|nr:glycosyltransferase family 2 protein [Oscillospiraceae bacterium]